MTPIDICFVTEELAPVTPGGIGTLVRNQVEALHDDGMRCRVLLDTSWRVYRRVDRWARKSLPGVEIRWVGSTRPQIRPGALRFDRFARSYRIWHALEELQRTSPARVIELADFCGPAFVSAHARAARFGSLRDALLAVRIHATEQLVAAAESRPVHAIEFVQLHHMEREALRLADAVLAPSRGVLELYERHYQLPARRLVVPPLYSSPYRALHRSRPTERRVLFFGKLQPIKGVDLIVDAVVRMLEAGAPHVDVDLVGPDTPSGPGYTSYRKLLQTQIPAPLRARFHFHERLSPDELEQLAARCRVAVVPSRFETYCFAASDAANLGLPLLLAPLAAFRDRFPAGPGVRFFDGTAPGLAAALADALEVEHPATHAEEIRTTVPAAVAAYRELARAEPASSVVVPEAAPLVSIVVPFFEAHATIDETIASVRNSRYRHWEAIIVDDGSSSSTALGALRALEVRLGGDSRFRFLRTEHGGLGRARNHGVQAARGKYVLPLDADDIVSPDLVSSFVAAATASPDAAMIATFAERFRGDGWRRQITDWYAPYGLHPVLLFYENGTSTATALLRRDVLLDHLYDESLDSYEDWDLYVRLALAGERSIVLPAPMFAYRQRPGGMISSMTWSRHQHLIEAMMARHLAAHPEVLLDVARLYQHSPALPCDLGSRSGSLRHDHPRRRAADLMNTVYLRLLRQPLDTWLTPRQSEWLRRRVKRWVLGRAST